MVDETDEEVLPDEDIRAAVRHWLSSNIWTSIFKYKLDNLSPGVLREREQKLPDMLLQDWDGERVIQADQNAILHAWSALENADYEGAGRGETLKRTITVLRELVKERVDRRLQAVFAPETLAPPAGVTVSKAQVSTMTPNMSKLSTFIPKWQDDIIRGYNGAKGLSDETTDQYLKTVELFVGLVGDLPLGKITFEVAADFREKLLQLPKSHGKSRTGSVKKELERARKNVDGPKLEMKTAKRHFSGMNSIWKWLVNKKHVPADSNPFAGHSFPGTKSKKSARDAWSSEDMKRLFTSSVYRSAPRDSAFHWMPLIGLFSGMRLEEIGRLRPRFDIDTWDGIYCFRIQSRDLKTAYEWDPKTEAGARIIPVHSWLLKHGFRDLVNSRIEAGSQHLFPELVMHGKKLTSGFSREFSRTKKSLGVGQKTAFHSFRHTFRTGLESTDHKESHINAAMGHEGGGGEGRVYTKGVTTKKLKEVVESFEPILDLGFLDSIEQAPDAPPKPATQRVKKRKLIPPTLDNDGKIVRRGPRRKIAPSDGPSSVKSPR